MCLSVPATCLGALIPLPFSGCYSWLLTVIPGKLSKILEPCPNPAHYLCPQLYLIDLEHDMGIEILKSPAGDSNM